MGRRNRANVVVLSNVVVVQNDFLKGPDEIRCLGRLLQNVAAIEDMKFMTYEAEHGTEMRVLEKHHIAARPREGKIGDTLATLERIEHTLAGRGATGRAQTMCRDINARRTLKILKGRASVSRYWRIEEI
ncbi:hypothetical protein GOBAR_DD22627 [Gossypium barbadense]|nr:hypothetical protein GOBAR_DD22627 [Gossypium barbadense]